MKFEEILVLATTITGLIWLIDSIFFAHKRKLTFAKQLKEPVVIEFSKACFPILLLVLGLRSFLAEPFRIPSASMKPTLVEGDYILVNKFTYGLRIPILGYNFFEINKPKRGDVIVFRHFDHRDLIKRVVGLPGDKIKYKNKKLYVNGKLVPTEEPKFIKDQKHNLVLQQTEKLDDIDHEIYIYPEIKLEDYIYADYTVPEGSYFVMGDNRDHSQDSRYWGAVSEQNIIGKAFAVWWSWNIIYFSDLLNFLDIHVYWNRIAKPIK